MTFDAKETPVAIVLALAVVATALLIFRRRDGKPRKSSLFMEIAEMWQARLIFRSAVH